jgi:two-component system sensor histidine kinase DegS
MSMNESHLSLFKERLRDPRFWIVQALVMIIEIGHTTLEASGTLQFGADLYLLPVSAYFVPVLYAALNFGLEGVIPTSIWCVVLTLPNLIFLHQGAERIGVSVQLSILFVLGTAVALRVDRERRAKLAAEAANRNLAELQASRELYIALALRAQEEERRRLARELHDETIQDLATIKASLSESADRSARFEGIDEALQRCIDGIRRMCADLRPSLLDDLGLVPALDWLLMELEGRTNAHTFLELEGDPVRLEPEVELVIFRIAQEALHNVEHHALAHQVTVRFISANTGVRLEVIDDGQGFSPLLGREGGLGLAGMRERAHLIRADLTVSSRPGETVVSLFSPLNTPGTPNSLDLVDTAVENEGHLKNEN